MEEVGVILPLVQTIQRVTSFINHLLFTMLHLEEQSQRDRHLLPVFLATSNVGVEDKCKETLQSAYTWLNFWKKTSSIKSKKTVPSIGRWWRCWRGIFCSVFLLAGQFFPETTLQREIKRRTLLLVSFSLYAGYKNPPKDANQKDKESFTKSHCIGSQAVSMRILLCSIAHLT